MVTIVATGGMEIKKEGELRAYLASCVGLALYDTKNKFGGILHILLPEPISNIPSTQQSFYATTGVPLFIDAMKNQGSLEQDMTAFIAGGAIIDSSSQEDYYFNIGGRTIGITLDIIKKSGISIKMLEASGVTPFCMSLNANTGKCTIDPILMDASADGIQYKKPRMDDIMKTIGRLLPIPQITLQISQMLSDDECDISLIADEIKKDQVLSAKVLKICNSSYMGLVNSIESIDKAIMYIGSKALLQMIVTVQTEKFLRSSEKGYSLCRGGMFHHALATARLSEQIAFIHGQVKPDVAYTAGLLHDIGKVVLDQFIAYTQPLFYRMMREQEEDSQIIERKILGIDHNQAGLLLAESWNLPNIIKDVILFHHSPKNVQDNKEIAHIVYIADVLSNKFLSGLELEHIDTSSFQDSLDFLKLTPPQIIDKITIFTNIF